MTKEEQRNKIREQLKEEGKSVSVAPLRKIKRFIQGQFLTLTKSQNGGVNKKTKKPPKIFYGLNTNK